MHSHLRRAISGLYALAGRQRRNGLQFRQFAPPRIIAEGRYRAEDFVDHVSVFAVRVKCEVTRAAAWRNRSEGRIVRRERALPRVEAIDEQLVEPEIGGNGEPIIGRKIDGMSVRLLLSLRVDARASVLNEGAGIFQFSALIN